MQLPTTERHRESVRHQLKPKTPTEGWRSQSSRNVISGDCGQVGQGRHHSKPTARQCPKPRKLCRQNHPHSIGETKLPDGAWTATDRNSLGWKVRESCDATESWLPAFSARLQAKCFPWPHGSWRWTGRLRCARGMVFGGRAGEFGERQLGLWPPGRGGGAPGGRFDGRNITFGGRDCVFDGRNGVFGCRNDVFGALNRIFGGRKGIFGGRWRGFGSRICFSERRKCFWERRRCSCDCEGACRSAETTSPRAPWQPGGTPGRPAGEDACTTAAPAGRGNLAGRNWGWPGRLFLTSFQPSASTA